MINLSVYDSYCNGVFDFTSFEKFNGGDFLPLVSRNACYPPSLKHYFQHLLDLHNDNVLPLCPEVKAHFEIIAKLPFYHESNNFFMMVTPYFNRETKFYSHLFQNFASACYIGFTKEMDKLRDEELRVELLSDFYEQAQMILVEMRIKEKPLIEDEAINSMAIQTLFCLYNEIFNRYGELHTDNEFNLNELIYLSTMEYPLYDSYYETSHNDYIVKYLNDRKIDDSKQSLVKEKELVIVQSLKENGLLGQNETMDFLHIASNQTLLNLVKDHRIEKVKIGGRNFYNVKAYQSKLT